MKHRVSLAFETVFYPESTSSFYDLVRQARNSLMKRPKLPIIQNILMREIYDAGAFICDVPPDRIFDGHPVFFGRDGCKSSRFSVVDQGFFKALHVSNHRKHRGHMMTFIKKLNGDASALSTAE